MYICQRNGQNIHRRENKIARAAGKDIPMGRRKTARLEPGDDENEDDIFVTMMAYPDVAPLIPPSKSRPARPPPAARPTPVTRPIPAARPTPAPPEIVLSAHARREKMAPVASGNPGKRRRQQEDSQRPIPAPASRASSSTQALAHAHRHTRPLPVRPRPVHTASKALVSMESQPQSRQNKANIPEFRTGCPLHSTSSRLIASTSRLSR